MKYVPSLEPAFMPMAVKLKEFKDTIINKEIIEYIV